MDNSQVATWVRMWRQRPADIHTHITQFGSALSQANGGQARLFWTTLEDLTLEHQAFAELAEHFLAHLMPQHSDVSRVEILLPLVAGNAQDLQNTPEYACMAWDLGSEWVLRHWGQAGLQRTVPIVPTLLGPKQGNTIVLNHIMASLGRQCPEVAFTHQPWIWSWLKLSLQHGQAMAGNIESLARFEVPIDIRQGSETPLIHTVMALETAQREDRNGNAWRKGHTTQNCLTTLDLLVQYGADWAQLDDKLHRFAYEHVQNHPKVRSEKLRGLLSDTMRADGPIQYRSEL